MQLDDLELNVYEFLQDTQAAQVAQASSHISKVACHVNAFSECWIFFPLPPFTHVWSQLLAMQTQPFWEWP